MKLSLFEICDGLPLNCEMLAGAYDYLRITPPFREWNLPDSEDVEFRVTLSHDQGEHEMAGRGRRRHHIIRVSSRCIGHTDSLMMVMAHEMQHMHQDRTDQSTQAEHNAAFVMDARVVCAWHGWDLKLYL